MAEYLLFQELFIEYVRSFFFKHPMDSFSQDDLVGSFPPYYSDRHMVQGALHILLLREMIEPSLPLMPDANGVSRDKWKANKKALDEIKDEKDYQILVRKIDTQIKQLSHKTLTYELKPKKYFWLVETVRVLIPAVVGFVIALLISPKDKAGQSISTTTLSTPPHETDAGSSKTPKPSSHPFDSTRAH